MLENLGDASWPRVASVAQHRPAEVFSGFGDLRRALSEPHLALVVADQRPILVAAAVELAELQQLEEDDAHGEHVGVVRIRRALAERLLGRGWRRSRLRRQIWGRCWVVKDLTVFIVLRVVVKNIKLICLKKPPGRTDEF